MTTRTEPASATKSSPKVGTASEPRSGLLVMRVWTEPEHPKPLRARIVRCVVDTGGAAHTPPTPDGDTVAATVGDAVDAVRSWLEAFVSS